MLKRDEFEGKERLNFPLGILPVETWNCHAPRVTPSGNLVKMFGERVGLELVQVAAACCLKKAKHTYITTVINKLSDKKNS